MSHLALAALITGRHPVLDLPAQMVGPRRPTMADLANDLQPCAILVDGRLACDWCSEAARLVIDTATTTADLACEAHFLKLFSGPILAGEPVTAVMLPRQYAVVHVDETPCGGDLCCGERPSEDLTDEDFYATV